MDLNQWFFWNFVLLKTGKHSKFNTIFLTEVYTESHFISSVCLLRIIRRHQFLLYFKWISSKEGNENCHRFWHILTLLILPCAFALITLIDYIGVEDE